MTIAQGASMQTRRLISLFATLGLTVACGGGDGDGGSAGAGNEFVACGGSVLGTWRVESMTIDAAALEPSALPEECGDWVKDAKVSETAITMDFGSDGNVKSNGQFTFELNTRYDAACINVLSENAVASNEFCGALAEKYGEDLEAEGQKGTATCSFADAGCACVMTRISDVDDNEAYSTSASSLLTIGDDAPAQYCVEGDELVVRPEEGEMRLRRVK